MNSDGGIGCGFDRLTLAYIIRGLGRVLCFGPRDVVWAGFVCVWYFIKGPIGI